MSKTVSCVLCHFFRCGSGMCYNRESENGYTWVGRKHEICPAFLSEIEYTRIMKITGWRRWRFFNNPIVDEGGGKNGTVG